MKLNLVSYKSQIGVVIKTVKKAETAGADVFSSITFLSAVTHLPIVTAYYYASLYLGMTDELQAYIEKLKEFHMVTEVLGYEEIKRDYEDKY